MVSEDVEQLNEFGVPFVIPPIGLDPATLLVGLIVGYVGPIALGKIWSAIKLVNFKWKMFWNKDGFSQQSYKQQRSILLHTAKIQIDKIFGIDIDINSLKYPIEAALDTHLRSFDPNDVRIAYTNVTSGNIGDIDMWVKNQNPTSRNKSKPMMNSSRRKRKYKFKKQTDHRG